jgi:peroxiredoxin
MRRLALPAALLLSLTVTLPRFLAGTPAQPATAPTLPDFTLKDPAGKAWSLSDFRGKKVVVVVFVGTECPINNAYMPRLVELHKTYAPRGVGFLAINSNSQDTPARIAGHAREHGIPFPVLQDTAAVVADKFGAKRTPEAFLLDPARKVLYRGRIDDQYGVGFRRKAPTRRDLAEALDEVLSGKPVSKPSADAPGCLIARPVKPKAGGPVTFAKQVSRILQKNCQECHRPGEVGPMPLLTYEDALAWSDMVREVVAEKRMPPWHADPRFGHWSNDRSLTKEDRDALLAWVDGGCPKGDDNDLPPPREFARGWTVGKPDVVFEMPQAFTVPAKVGSAGLKYQYFVAPTNFSEDRWVQAAEARPGNRAVVHHIIVYVAMPGQKRQPGEDGIGDGFLTAYAPGDLPAVFPPGTAKKLPKGCVLAFQMHYTPNGVEQPDRSSVGLVFAKAPPRHEVRTRAIAEKFLTIPKGAANHPEYASSQFDRDAEILGLFPHMHLRGKDFEFRAAYPDGKSETLLRVPRYDFNWQSTYRLAKPLKVPAGTRIDCTAHYDNSAGNPNNPDPTKDVIWGDQTWEEMLIGFVDYVYTSPEK